MPALLAPFVGFAFGALLAWLGAAAPRRLPSRTPTQGALPPDRRPLALACLFSALVFTPACAYFLLFAPDWSFAYLIDSRRIPSAVDLVLLAIAAASVPAGFAALARALARRALRAPAALIGAPLALALLAALILAPRLAVDGTYRQVHGDFGVRPVAGGPLGYALLWIDGLLVAGLALTARAILTVPPRPVDVWGLRAVSTWVGTPRSRVPPPRYAPKPPAPLTNPPPSTTLPLHVRTLPHRPADRRPDPALGRGRRSRPEGRR